MTVPAIAMRAAVVVGTLLAILVLWQIWVAVAILFAALALGACMFPLVEHLQERGWPRSFAIVLAVSSTLIIVVGLVGALAVPVVYDLQELGGDLTQLVEDLRVKYPDHWLVKSMRPAQPPVDAVDGAAPSSSLLTNSMRSLIGSVPELIQLGAHMAICVALSVYWTIDRQRIERLWLSLVPVKRRPGARKIAQSVERDLGAYLRSEFVQGLLAALLLWAGFEFLGLRYAAVAAVIAAILMMIPWLGNLFAIAAVAMLASGKIMDLEAPWMALPGWFAIGYVAIVVAFLQFVIEPRLFNEDRYNSLWTVLITLALTYTFGVWGLIFGPPVGYGIQIVVRQLQPFIFYEPVRYKSFDAIARELEELRARHPREETPPEVISFIDRLESLIESRTAAEPEKGLPVGQPEP